MRCYICDNELELLEQLEEEPVCLPCWYAIEDAINREEIEEGNDTRPV